METIGLLANLGNAGLFIWRIYREVKKSGLKPAVVSLLNTIDPKLAESLLNTLDKLDGQELPEYSIQTLISNLTPVKGSVELDPLHEHPYFAGSGQVRRYRRRHY